MSMGIRGFEEFKISDFIGVANFYYPTQPIMVLI